MSGGDATTMRSALDPFLRSKQKTDGSGNYRRNAERVVEDWLDWCEDRGVETFADLDVVTMRRYARRLKRRVDGGGISGSTANTYYSYVASFLTWCRRDELVAENHARKKRAQEELPDDRPARDGQQHWTPDQRERLLSFVSDRARDALDETERDALPELRDRALVATLAYTGVRAGEVFRDPNDDRRDGLRWSDVDFAGRTVSVLGKDQRDEEAPLPSQVIPSLRRYETALEPGDDWPVFPSRHPPSVGRRLRSALTERGWTGDEIDAAIGEHGVQAALRRFDVTPPALSTSGARSRMRTLCEQADVGVDDGHGYLTPHGGRRGVGDELFRADATTAQKALRHKSPETTSDQYEYIEAGETADAASEIFGDGSNDA